MKKVLFTATVDSHILQFHIPFLKKFKEKGYEVHVATNGNEEIPYCDVKHIVSFERSPIKLNNIKAIRQLKKICDKEKFDIIHTHTPMGAVVTRIAAKKTRKENHTRVIYTAHGFHFYKGASIKNWMLFYPVEKYLAKYTDTLITINKEDYDLAKNKFQKRCSDIQYVPGVGIDEKKFDFELSEQEKKQLRESLKIKKDDFVLIYPAELSKRKRQVWLINSIKDLLKHKNNIHLLLPGKDSLNGKAQKLVKQLELEKNVHFLGYRKDIPKLLKISDAAVSSANQEGLPVNIMEAMYVGLPIVATDCRGNRDLVENQKNGFLISLNDNDLFKKSIENIYNSKKLNILFSKESKKMIENYMLPLIMNKMEKIYNFNGLNRVAIITSGFLPIPAVKGGAAENLIDTLIDENEKYEKIIPYVFSIYDKEALKASNNVKETSYIFIKPSKISVFVDKIIYFFVDKIFKKKNSRKFRYIFQRFSFLHKCSVILKNNNFNKIIIENHTIMYLSLKFKKNYIKYKDSYYYHCHNIVPGKYRMDKIIDSTKKVISVSEFRNNYAKEFFFSNKNNDKCRVVLNCCSNDILVKCSSNDKKEIKKKYNISNEKTILYVGRIDKDKGTYELVKSFNNLNEKKCKLLIAGAPIFATGVTSEYENVVREEAKNNSNIIFTGYINHNELYKLYAIADFVVIPSQIDDSAPLVLIESLTCGKPVIASNCGGIPEYTNNDCAILIDLNKDYISNLSNAMKKLLEDDILRKKMSSEALIQSQRYNTEKYYNDFINEIID